MYSQIPAREAPLLGVMRGVQGGGDVVPWPDGTSATVRRCG